MLYRSSQDFPIVKQLIDNNISLDNPKDITFYYQDGNFLAVDLNEETYILSMNEYKQLIKDVYFVVEDKTKIEWFYKLTDNSIFESPYRIDLYRDIMNKVDREDYKLIEDLLEKDPKTKYRKINNRYAKVP